MHSWWSFWLPVVPFPVHHPCAPSPADAVPASAWRLQQVRHISPRSTRARPRKGCGGGWHTRNRWRTYPPPISCPVVMWWARVGLVPRAPDGLCVLDTVGGGGGCGSGRRPARCGGFHLVNVSREGQPVHGSPPVRARAALPAPPPSGVMSIQKHKLKMSVSSVPQASDSEAAELWRSLQAAIRQIFAQNASQLSFEVLHRYDPCGGRVGAVPVSLECNRAAAVPPPAWACVSLAGTRTS